MTFWQTTRRRFLIGVGATGALAVLPVLPETRVAVGADPFRAPGNNGWFRGILRGTGMSESFRISSTPWPGEIDPDVVEDLMIKVWYDEIEATLPGDACRSFVPGHQHVALEYRGLIDPALCGRSDPIDMAFRAPYIEAHYRCRLMIDSIKRLQA